MSNRPAIRSAIYTRKSSDEGLEQDFNSLDAQREACAAYIASQRHEGWRLIKTHYDDGGLSGSTLERPALQRLLADIDTGRIDMIVVYKIDRLTRSLADFARLVERLDAAGCSFVSVTQSFNTSTSMGRLTLNVLLSFAQFEREVTAERIRDKIAASKKKGLWMGGVPPLGYDPHPDPTRRELVVNQAEAGTVAELFELYDQLGCLRRVEAEARRRGLRSKNHHFSTGRKSGGNPLTRGQIHHILTNPIYIGQIRHKDKVWPGKHEAIIGRDLWDRVQRALQRAGRRPRGRSKRGEHPETALLAGKFRDETGDLLTPTHTLRRGRRLRYYVSNRLISQGTDPAGWRLPGPAFETAVGSLIAAHLETCTKQHRLCATIDLTGAAAPHDAANALAAQVRSLDRESTCGVIVDGEIGRGRIRISLDQTFLANTCAIAPDAFCAEALTLSAPFAMRRRGVEAKLIVGECAPTPDPTLVQALARAHRWTATLRQGTPIGALARNEGHSESYVRVRAQLAFLSPTLQRAIIEGRQPPELTLETIVRAGIPLGWTEQERRFGMDLSHPGVP